MRVASISYVGLLTMMTVLIFLFGPHPVTSQSETDTCLPIVQRILEEVGNRCGDMTRNSACYGNSSISATFVDTASDNVFTEPGDTTEVTRLQKLETAPLSPDFNIWGVSLMKLQASIPNTIPGQGVIFVLYGDVSLENAVPDNNNFSPIDEPISVITRSGANIRSGPSTNNNVLASVPSGAELAADAVNPDRTWLRVVTEGQIGWVSTQVLRSNDKMSTLPVLTRESRMPMQSFYLSASVAGVTCAEAPALLVVQGPEGVIVDITANGVDIRMGSTIVIRMLDSHTMEVIAIHGTVRIGNPLIPPGFAITVPLTEDGQATKTASST
ncbi:MAG: SH3 domain-containing protein [Anaerolineae bacterium]